MIINEFNKEKLIRHKFISTHVIKGTTLYPSKPNKSPVHLYNK